MARYTDSVCKLCRREGMKLFLKGERCLSPKCAMERRAFPPGIHGKKQTFKRKTSDYGVQLREKQKARRIYGVMERQFRRYFEEANRTTGLTGINLLAMLERRLDNVVYRLGFADSRAQARQIVRHGHFEVNGRRVHTPSYRLRKGDVVTLREKSREMITITWNKDTLDRAAPAWLERGENHNSITVRELPVREQIDVPVREQLIVELYSK